MFEFIGIVVCVVAGIFTLKYLFGGAGKLSRGLTRMYETENRHRLISMQEQRNITRFAILAQACKRGDTAKVLSALQTIDIDNTETEVTVLWFLGLRNELMWFALAQALIWRCLPDDMQARTDADYQRAVDVAGPEAVDSHMRRIMEMGAVALGQSNR